MSEWRGVVPALITPLTDGGRKVDLDAFSDYCSFMAGKGVQGVFCCGTTGEGPLLTLEERKSVAETAVKELRGRVKVIVQAGCITTEETIVLAKHSREIGADAVGVVFPYYYRYNDELLYTHFMRVAEAVPGFPLFIYNIPVFTGNNMSHTLFERLLKEIDSLVGLKNSNDDMFQIIEFIRLSGEKCSIFNGNDGIILPSLACGAGGLVSGNASAFPEPFVEIYNAVAEGDLTLARKIQQDIDRLRGVLACGRDNASFKKALEFRGIRAGGVRRPDKVLTNAESKKLRDSLKKLGVI